MKQKSFFCRILSGISLLLLLTACTPSGQQTSLTSEEEEFPVSEFPAANLSIPALPVEEEGKIKGVWVSYLEFDHMLKGRSEKKYRANIQDMVKNCKEQELNTLIVQVRSHGDAYYPSQYYPWSVHVTGSPQKSCSFDPLKILIEEAQKEDLSVHAWINPYRLMQEEEMELVSKDYKIREWYQNDSYMEKGTDGYWYLNAGNDEVQELIVNGIQELITNYDLDGIQIDDYFYDKVKPKAFGESDKEGRENVTQMVKKIYQCVKNQDAELLFGISPAGNFRESPVSDSTQLTDLSLWCTEEGYLDYVAPQIYWDFEDPEAPFLEVLEKWENLVKDSPVKLYVGLAAYKFSESEILEEEMKTVLEREVPQGYFLFRYDNLV